MIPTVDDLRSCGMTHKMGDVFNPPGLTNFIGTVQADLDVTGISSLNFPPFSCSPQKTAALFIDGKYFAASGNPVTLTWYPDRIVREAAAGPLQFRSVSVLCIGKTAFLEEITIKNTGSSLRTAEFRLQLSGGIVREENPWLSPPVPGDGAGVAEVDTGRKAVLFTSRVSTAFNMQGIYPRADRIDEQSLTVRLSLRPGTEGKITYANVSAPGLREVRKLYDAVIASGEQEILKAREDWNKELAAVFTQGNNRYSGFLPELETSDEDIRRVYYTGILGVIYFKRDNPYSVYGRAYDTLMPKFWQTVTFLWDYSLSSLVHALLDPAVMQKYLEKWMHVDIHRSFGTEYLTGGTVGPWYSVNDFAMIKMMHNFLRWTGKHGWLDKEITDKTSGKGKKVIDYLEMYALHWKELQSSSGLADYGEINNLLECVSSYIHEVASLNGANIYNMRTMAEIFAARGAAAKSETLHAEADRLFTALQQLYADGSGYWYTRFPDGTLKEVRHVYDFITILNNISEDLSDKQKAEMCGFFERELQTPVWMSALSPGDNDALYSLRPDHQWNGSYPAWPAQSVSALYKAGRADLGFSWLKGLAKSANQGPYGQAHFTEAFIDPENGGARKTANTEPYICDWTVSSGGSWADIIIESIFGVQASMYRGITAEPQFGRFDPDARLKNLHYQGRLYDVDRKGIIHKT